MNKSRRLLFSAAMGVGIFGMSKGVGASAPTYERVNQPVVACAGVLGNKAVVSATVPEQCEPGNFKSVEHITRTYIPTNGYQKEVSSVEYFLTTKHEYLKQNYESREDFDAGRRLLGRTFVVISALGALVMYPLSRGLFPDKSLHDQGDQASVEGEQV